MRKKTKQNKTSNQRDKNLEIEFGGTANIPIPSPSRRYCTSQGSRSIGALCERKKREKKKKINGGRKGRRAEEEKTHSFGCKDPTIPPRFQSKDFQHKRWSVQPRR
jgi:hypothetical protein